MKAHVVVSPSHNTSGGKFLELVVVEKEALTPDNQSSKEEVDPNYLSRKRRQ